MYKFTRKGTSVVALAGSATGICTLISNNVRAVRRAQTYVSGSAHKGGPVQLGQHADLHHDEGTVRRREARGRRTIKS